MKQHITKEQWKELDEDGRYKIFAYFNRNNKDIKKADITLSAMSMLGHVPLTIGQLIDFLGDDFNHYCKDYQTKKHSVQFWNGEMTDCKYFEEKELIDALWEATKYKLKQ